MATYITVKDLKARQGTSKVQKNQNMIKSSSSSGSSSGGMSKNDSNAISIAKEAYNIAASKGDTAGMNAAHQTAENIRSQYGYSGGTDGSGYYNTASGSTGGSGGTSTNYGTYQSDLDKLTKAQRQAQVDQLKAARTKALANLDVQQQQIKPLYENARNQTAAASQQGARNFAEYLANRGLTNSGAAAQGEINRQSNLVNNLGNLNTAEANAYRDIANQRTVIENDYAANLANANNAITNNYYNNLLNYNEQQRQMVQALQQQALGQYANDYQAQINNLLSQGYAPNSLEVLQLQALRGNKSNQLYNAGQQNALANIQAGNINYNNAAALGMTVPQAQQFYDNYVAQQQAAAQAQAEALQREIEQQQYKNTMDYNNYLLNAQKVANDTAQTQYNVNKPYYKPTTPKTDSGVQGIIERLITQGYSDEEIAKMING